MIENQVVGQILGFVSFALGIYAFYQKDDRKLKIFMFLFGITHAIHYLFLGSIVSTLSAGLSATRTGVAIYISSKKMAFIFITLGLISALYIAEDFWALWAMMGMIFGTYSVFVLKGIPMRIGFVLGAICWLINNISVGSIGGILLETTLVSMNILTIIRLLRDQRQVKEDSEVE